MEFEQLHQTWHQLGATDPRWAILSEPSRRGGGGDDASFWQSGVGFVAWVAQHLDGLGAVPPRGRALDFGCGHGRLTQALAPYFDAVVGVDIAESMLAAARAANRHGDRVTYVHNARPDLSQFAAGSFDFVLTMLVLQHMRSDYAKTYLREFLRLLRPGGIAFFQLPIEPLAPLPIADAAVTAAPGPVAATALSATTSLVPSRLNFVAGGCQWLRVELHNRGASTWHAAPGPGGVEVGLRFQRLDASAVPPSVWVPLSADVPAGARAAVLAAVRAPATAGSYVLSALPGVERGWCEHPGNVAASTLVRVGPVSPAASAEPPPRPSRPSPDRRHPSGIEVHGTPLAEVEAVVREAGGALVDVGLDGWAGYEWVSAHCTVRKG
jgi:SAM-dependent methyltransferase